MATTGATTSQEEGVFATSRATSGSTNTGTTSGSTTPGSSTTSGGTSANDATITIVAGTGLGGGEAFTVNQAADESITLNILDTGVTAQQYTLANVNTITVNAQGQITAVGTHSVTPMARFQPGESNRVNTGTSNYMATTGGNASGAVSTTTQTLTVETEVDTGFTVTSTNYEKEASSTNPSSTVDTDGTVTIPPNTEGTTVVGGTVMVSGPNSNGVTETRTVTADTVEVDTFIPYFFGFMSTETTLSTVTGLTESTSAIASGDQITVTYSGSGTQYAYIALPDSIRRTDVTFALSLFEVTPDDGGTAAFGGNNYNVYRFPSRGNFVVTVTF